MQEDGRVGVWEALETLAHPLTPLVLFFLTAPLLWFYYIYQPCFISYDFEAAVAHEIGHVLGFDHPDQYPALNLNTTLPMSAASCHEQMVGSGSNEFLPTPTAADGGALDTIHVTWLSPCSMLSLSRTRYLVITPCISRRARQHHALAHQEPRTRLPLDGRPGR